jgi:hypothetical protein
MTIQGILGAATRCVAGSIPNGSGSSALEVWSWTSVLSSPVASVGKQISWASPNLHIIVALISASYFVSFYFITPFPSRRHAVTRRSRPESRARQKIRV